MSNKGIIVFQFQERLRECIATNLDEKNVTDNKRLRK